MRERLVGYLEKGGRCLHRAVPTQPHRSRRLLHSAFWSHGAGNIDLPSWWISLLQLPQTQQEQDAGRDKAGPRFLEFLYPSQTLAFMGRYATADPAVFRRHQRTPKVYQRSREYASITADDASEVQDLGGLEAKSAEQEVQIERVAKEIASTDVVRRETLVARLDELLLHDTRDAQHLQLWQTYQELRDLSVLLLPRQLVRMMRCLTRSTSNIDQERLLELFDSISIPEKRSIHYSYAVSAALRLDRLEVAVRSHKEALSKIRGSIGTSALLQYAIEKGLWQVAIETWQESIDQEGRTSERLHLWDKVDILRTPDLWEKASSALDYASQMKDLAGRDAAASARDFAWQFTLRSLLLGSANEADIDEAKNVFGLRYTGNTRVARDSRVYRPGLIARLRPNVAKHEDMVNRAIALQAPAKQLYTAAIFQTLRFKTRAYDTLALKYYQALRNLADEIPSRATVIAMLRRLCFIHSSAGILMVLNDYRFFYGELPPHALELVIPEFAHQGNRQIVEDLLREYQSKVPTIENSHVANALLYVCNRRGETKAITKAFHSLQQDLNFEPDRRSWNTVIATYARVGDVDEASKWFNDFLDASIKPDKRSFIFMMSMFAKRGDLDAVQQLLRQSADLGVPTDISMIDCLVLTQIQNRELENAEKLVEEALNTVEDVPKSSRTRMWNYVLNAYALRGDLEKVTTLHRRMRENGVPSDGITFAALMQCLAIRERLRGAHQILADIMPQADVAPTALHYGILMSGYLQKKQYWMVFKLYSLMLEENLKPTMGTQNYLVRAAAMSDATERTEGGPDHDQGQYERAQQTIEQTLADIDPMELATAEPIKFVGNQRLDDAFSSSYFAYMVYFYGRDRALDKAIELYDRYIEKRRELDMDVETSPPIQMLSALMVAGRNAQDYERVSKCWHLSLEKARILARRSNANTSEPGWVLPARSYILNTHLRYYVSSLAVQQRFTEIDQTIDHLLRCGYVLDSRSWNQYIVVLLQNHQRLKAFKLCEEELMPGWEGWALLGNVSPQIQQRMQRRQPKHLQLHHRHPQYMTLVYLAAAFVGAQSESRDRWGRTEIDRLRKAAPRTVKAVFNLPRLDDWLQGRLLKET